MSTIPSYGFVLDEHDEIITVVGVAVLGLCPHRAGAIQNCRVWMPQSPPYRLACDRLAVSAAVPSLMRSVTDPYQDVAAIVGGAAMIISLLLDWLVVPYEKLGVAGAYLTASYPVSSGLRLLGTVLFLWALLALYNRQSIAVGTFGLWSFVVAFFGTALLAGEVWAEVFVWPTFARVAPNVFTEDLTDAAYLITGRSLSAYLFGIGIILFGVATLKAGVYPGCTYQVLGKPEDSACTLEGVALRRIPRYLT